ncbi:glycosyltransferase family 2 protein [Bibersteinia trehalosi]|uniref:Glycosyltransferase family 2 protein n=1 Tax=Bibersteinia trehalosi TaxID=47735 RepID=A0A426FGD9_BIBTR|nr:glycosyltransferase [Bibersteinia trehalosi]RRN01638.1 glycosyltransferase family 2 protein [Bibersteinia trehalosi]
MNFTLIIPTYNAGDLGVEWIKRYQSQSLKANKVIVIDSSSIDQTVQLAQQAGFFVYKIAKSEFNHGGTRNLAVQFIEPNTEILVFMTQDALFASPNSLENLLKPFEDPNVAAVCGRQLPHKNANPLATHARLFNYPEDSKIKSLSDVSKLGIKTAFMSNSFAAYRKSVFEELGGFPNNTILAEDMYLTAKMLLAGYKVAYCAEAEVYHSHNYSLKQEFQRYFDTGVFQANEPWIQQNFGKASGEGTKFVLSEIKYLLNNNPMYLPRAFFSTLMKYIGFKLGLNWNKLPNNWLKKLSMYREYWKQ